jgi:hypothetical protein
MRPSRLAIALLIALRSVLVYGEASNGVSAQLTWRELLPARWRDAGAGLARAGTTAAGRAAPQPVVGRPA